MLKACMTRADITPPKGVELGGYPHYPRNNEGAHDPLHAACMYLANGENEVAMVTLDLLFFSKIHIAKVRKQVNERCGIPEKNIMISSSHTHSAPQLTGEIMLQGEDSDVAQMAEYTNFVIDAIANIICEAKANAYPAYFASGTAVCGAESGIGGNRRMPGGPHDPLVSVMAIKDENDDVRGALVNYTLHPTFIHEWSNVCTADYPCYLKMQLEEIYTKALTGYAQGTSGNQSSRYYRQGESFDEAERVGRILGKAAASVIEKAEWTNEMPIAVATDEIAYEFRNFGTEEELRANVARDKAIYEELYAKYGKSENRDEYYLWQNANLKLLGSEHKLDYMLRYNRGEIISTFKDERPAEVLIIRLGDTCVVGVQGEIFVEYGLYIKGMAGFKTVIVNELTNGLLPGYLYTPEALANGGGYEADTSMLPGDYGQILVETVLKTIKKVKE